MTELDTLLARLGEESAGARLDTLEARVMTGLAQRREQTAARRGYMLASCLAVIVGSAAAVAPHTPASSAPLLGVPAAAPSHLLVD
ncbi:hypothetical protein [Novosphingobium naphthalenivorans]|uniref:hypothetical protein n=1 Tax=Novosphingobium naphthalenivorans TaxID=273168 RepID=UPI0008316E18|nr:hypothetical protein [Novosphingobium naphthalenivorans]